MCDFKINEEKCIDILGRLVMINSENSKNNEINMVNEILKIVGKDTTKFKIIRHGRERSSLIIEIEGMDPTRKIGFVGHMDTVDIGDISMWDINPFEGRYEDGYVYGRGSTDMKGGLTAMIMFILYFKTKGKKPPINIELFFTADEENNGIGVSELVHRGCFHNLESIFVCEPTDGKIGIAEKGAIWIDIKVTGKSGHASMPQYSVNAFEKGIDYIYMCKNEIEKGNQHYLLGSNTFSITKAFSGIQTNIIPNFASFLVDVRTVPDKELENSFFINKFMCYKELLYSTNKNLNINIKVINNREAIEIDKNHSFIEELKCVYKNLNYNFEYTGINYYTDASQIIPISNIPFVILGPGNPKDCHIINEKIEISSIINVLRVYISYVESL